MHSMRENKENTHSEVRSKYMQYIVEIKLKAVVQRRTTGRGFCDCKLQRNQCKHKQHKGVRGWGGCCFQSIGAVLYTICKRKLRTMSCNQLQAKCSQFQHQQKTAATTATTITQHSHQNTKAERQKQRVEKKEILYYSKPKKYNEKCSVSAFVFRTS